MPGVELGGWLGAGRGVGESRWGAIAAGALATGALPLVVIGWQWGTVLALAGAAYGLVYRLPIRDARRRCASRESALG